MKAMVHLMRNITLASAFLLLIFFSVKFAYATNFPPEIGRPPPLNEQTNMCINLEAEFGEGSMFIKEVEGGERARYCYRLKGHNNDVGLVLSRFSLNQGDNVLIRIYKTNDYVPLELNVEDKTIQVFDLSNLLNIGPTDELFIEFILNRYSIRRKVIFGYQLSESGTYILTAGITMKSPPVTDDNLKRDNLQVIDLSRSQVSIITNELASGSSSFNLSEDTCGEDTTPPPGISDEIPLNEALKLVDGQTLKYYLEQNEWVASKIIAEIFEVSSNESSANRSVLVTSAIGRAEQYRDKKHRSFFLGAAEVVAGSSNLSSMVRQLTTDKFDNDEINRGANYGFVFISDSVRYEVKDSCVREPMRQYGNCTVPKRDLLVKGIPTSSYKYLKNPWEFGSDVSLEFNFDAFTNPDLLYLVTVGGDLRGRRTIYSTPAWMYGEFSFNFDRHDDDDYGPIRFYVKGRNPGSELLINVKCTPIEIDPKDSGSIIITPSPTPYLPLANF